MLANYIATKDTTAFSQTVNFLRRFFLEKGFEEAHTQDRLSILAACEDPTTIAKFEYAGELWPLPQTGQMWLEYELLTNPHKKGVFCVSTSYRQEQNPIPGRHEIIFPMFEFEAKGGFDELKELEIELCEYLGLGSRKDFVYLSYEEALKFYKVKEITSQEEKKMGEDFGLVVFLEKFPEWTWPFWNMKRSKDKALKIDVIINGMETIGSAERSCDPKEMRQRFETISHGQYAKKLFDEFGEERVRKELDGFLSLNFFPRYGGGIGMTRLIKALKDLKLL